MKMNIVNTDTPNAHGDIHIDEERQDDDPHGTRRSVNLSDDTNKNGEIKDSEQQISANFSQPLLRKSTADEEVKDSVSQNLMNADHLKILKENRQ